jgi:hypothetical protein
MAMNATQAPKVSNLRETRREMAEARKRHPAGKAAPAKAPAKKAPAKKAAAKTGAAKLRWQFADGFANRATTGQTASWP